MFVPYDSPFYSSSADVRTVPDPAEQFLSRIQGQKLFWALFVHLLFFISSSADVRTVPDPAEQFLSRIQGQKLFWALFVHLLFFISSSADVRTPAVLDFRCTSGSAHPRKKSHPVNLKQLCGEKKISLEKSTPIRVL